MKTKQEGFIDIYHFAMEQGLNCLYRYFRSINQHRKRTYLIFEARGLKEDKALQEEFFRVRDGENRMNTRLPFDLVIADKKTKFRRASVCGYGCKTCWTFNIETSSV